MVISFYNKVLWCPGKQKSLVTFSSKFLVGWLTAHPFLIMKGLRRWHHLMLDFLHYHGSWPVGAHSQWRALGRGGGPGRSRVNPPLPSGRWCNFEPCNSLATCHIMTPSSSLESPWCLCSLSLRCGSLEIAAGSVLTWFLIIYWV